MIILKKVLYSRLECTLLRELESRIKIPMFNLGFSNPWADPIAGSVIHSHKKRLEFFRKKSTPERCIKYTDYKKELPSWLIIVPYGILKHLAFSSVKSGINYALYWSSEL